MCMGRYMLPPAIKPNIVLRANVFAALVAAAAASDDVDRAAGGVVDGEVWGGFTVDVEGACVVEELVGLAVGLELVGEKGDGDHFCGDEDSSVPSKDFMLWRKGLWRRCSIRLLAMLTGVLTEIQSGCASGINQDRIRAKT